MSSYEFDLIVLGGGPAGYAAAMRTIDFGKKVCLIEKSRIGGAGIYHGALSSKTLWELSQRVRNVNEMIAASGRDKFELSWNDVKKNLEEAVFERKFQYSCHLKLLKKNRGDLFFYERGAGKLISNHEIEITKNDGAIKIISAENIIIATGSSPRTLPNMEVDEVTILTSDGIDNITDFPKSMVIVGAGVIGCEYATIFSNFGKTKVYLIDRADRILPFEDLDISTMVSNNLEDNGVTIHHKAQLNRLEIIDGQVEYELLYEDGNKEVIRVEKALLSVGRISNIDNIGLEELGIKRGPNGRNIGDDDTQTNIPNIYAVGDASGRIALVNMGEIEARHAVEKMFDDKKERLSYDNVCTIMFLQPEVAAVGLNEQMCIEQNIPIKVVKLDYSTIARAIAMRKTQGFFKIIVTNDDKMQILGMRAVGEHASSAIQGVALQIKSGKGIETIAELVHPHPSIVEGVQECVRMLLNKSLFKASVFQDKLACYSLVDGVKTELQRL
ncbi:pyridine nucleotide-disulfide oxidoreductase [Putridiphycobacter roseus]|uniref:Pyridine nucleotide-disulfide oxidoreductase n=1 Tax=Putridiphycobacter roseus TaxID=2219161 RepID=A0A2W1NG21_9FLAO|nr:NAD(P)/FAD-dependent oxidoreductase [Putridiphycobacter roseus]PZE18043.1 pyridine nucleotide-disulfide oxidoreductase [Putridiphycobacter roseus]